MIMTKEIIEKLIIWEQDGNSIYARNENRDDSVMLSSRLQIGAEYDAVCLIMPTTSRAAVLFEEINQFGDFLYNCYEAIERDQNDKIQEAFEITAEVSKRKQRIRGVA